MGEKKYYHAHTRLLRVRLRCTRVSESSKIPISLLSGGDSPRAQGNEKFIMKIATEFFFLRFGEDGARINDRHAALVFFLVVETWKS